MQPIGTLARRDPAQAERHQPSLSGVNDRKGQKEGSSTVVFVLDQHKKPLMPCSEKRARLLLKRGRAVIHKMARSRSA